MRVRRMIASVSAIGLACLLLLIGCSQSQPADKPDLSALGAIHVIAREDGSGTRAQFETLVNTSESGTTQIASSTEDVIAAVEKDPSAIGYVAMSAIRVQEAQEASLSDGRSAGSDTAEADSSMEAENTSFDGLSGSADTSDINASGIRILSIGGNAPDDTTIRNRKYPLTRSYYLAWQGEASDLEREFVTYARSAGQTIVAKEAVPVAKETTFLSLKPAGTLLISGSTSMTPMVQELATDYQSYNPNVVIQINESDSTQGLIDAIQGKTDLAMSSRDLKDYEQTLLSYKEIAADGIVIIVNSQNALPDLDLASLRNIYDGTITEWSGI